MFLLVLKLALVVAVVATAAADGDNNNNTSSRVLSRKHSLPEKKRELVHSIFVHKYNVTTYFNLLPWKRAVVAVVTVRCLLAQCSSL